MYIQRFSGNTVRNTTILLLAIAFGVLIAGSAFTWGGINRQPIWSDAAVDLAVLLGLVSSIYAASTSRGRDRVVWIWFALGSGMLLLGEGIWAYYDLVIHVHPTPAPYDVCFLAILPMFLGALLQLGHDVRSVRALLLLDTILVAFAAAAVFITVFWSSLVDTPTGVPGRVIAMLYPVLATTLAFNLAMLPVRQILHNASFRLMMLALIVQAVAAYLWAPRILHPQVIAANTTVLVFEVLAMLLIPASALTFQSFPDVVLERQVHGINAVIPLILSPVAALLLLWHFFADSMNTSAQRVLGSLTVGLLITMALRLGETLRNSRMLYGELRESREFIRHQSLHDELTGLPNRRLFYERLNRAILTNPSAPSTCAILLIDLNGFKRVNDTLGHSAGDAILQEAAQRIEGLLRSMDTAARLGGDEFCVVLPLTDASGALKVAAKIVTAFSNPIDTTVGDAHIGTSIGLAVCPTHGRSQKELLHSADLAMYSAKRNGGGCVPYSPGLEGLEVLDAGR